MEANKIVKAMRIYLGLTQAEAAKMVGISEKVYQNYENRPGFILKGHFLSVYKILEVMYLNPKKFYEEKYELTEIGKEITSRGKGPITQKQRKAMQNCRPVRIKGKDDSDKIHTTVI
jgi:transcriptional regulator with XRE-family HTH domain